MRVVGEYPHEISDLAQSARDDAMLIADYIAISVLIVLATWAGAERFL
jgi:hypothetical protein